MPELKDESEALRLGLLAGYVQPAEVIAWADASIAAGDIPGPQLIEVSLAGSHSAKELAHMLAAIPGTARRDEVAQNMIRRIAEVVARDPSSSRGAARTLYEMYLAGYIPASSAEAEMIRLEDCFALAESGTWGSLDEACCELQEFLATWSRP